MQSTGKAVSVSWLFDHQSQRTPTAAKGDCGWFDAASMPCNKCRHMQKIEGRIDGERCPVWFVYSGMGSQWAGMARDMMRIACFRDSIMSCTAAVSAYECDPYALIMHGDDNVWTNTMNCIVCITAVQVQIINNILAEYV